ncbi:hypothetical protein C2845_PM13G20380 [Panicum miliaceum]|uniref:Uncharacterized protein n=1 Tax=Panicum miliaceum TaxID=4540 RepID=A0A3L6RJN1_PANMI|nr:hypothetical protein C2845_PM13G20380 [Panicum miliaceum]
MGTIVFRVVSIHDIRFSMPHHIVFHSARGPWACLRAGLLARHEPRAVPAPSPQHVGRPDTARISLDPTRHDGPVRAREARNQQPAQIKIHPHQPTYIYFIEILPDPSSYMPISPKRRRRSNLSSSCAHPSPCSPAPHRCGSAGAAPCSAPAPPSLRATALHRRLAPLLRGPHCRVSAGPAPTPRHAFAPRVRRCHPCSVAPHVRRRPPCAVVHLVLSPRGLVRQTGRSGLLLPNGPIRSGQHGKQAFVPCLDLNLGMWAGPNWARAGPGRAARMANYSLWVIAPR